jgi:hypothetical protein
MARTQVVATACHSEGLADILERVLDKGVVIAGDIKIKICDIELLTIQIRLLIASVDKAREMGLSWWWQSPQQQLPPQPLPPQPVAEMAATNVPHLRSQAPATDGLLTERRAQPVEHIFAQLSQSPTRQRGPSNGQNIQKPAWPPVAR